MFRVLVLGSRPPFALHVVSEITGLPISSVARLQKQVGSGGRADLGVYSEALAVDQKVLLEACGFQVVLQ